VGDSHRQSSGNPHGYCPSGTRPCQCPSVGTGAPGFTPNYLVTVASPWPSACIGGSITLRGFIDGIFADDHVIVPDHDRMLLRDAETCPRLRGGRLLRNSCASAFS